MRMDAPRGGTLRTEVSTYLLTSILAQAGHPPAPYRRVGTHAQMHEDQNPGNRQAGSQTTPQLDGGWLGTMRG